MRRASTTVRLLLPDNLSVSLPQQSWRLWSVLQPGLVDGDCTILQPRGCQAEAPGSEHAGRAVAWPLELWGPLLPLGLPGGMRGSSAGIVPTQRSPTTRQAHGGIPSRAAALHTTAAGCSSQWNSAPQASAGRESPSGSGRSSSSSSSSSTNGTGAAGSGDPLLSPGLEARLKQLHSRCAQLESQLAGGDGGGGGASTGGGAGTGGTASALREAGREYAQLQPMAQGYERLVRLRNELVDLAALSRDPDAGVRAMAEEEGEALRQEMMTLTRQLLLALLPRDPRDGRPVLLEVRAGAGGLEAALFAGELLDMYGKLAQSRGWSWEVLEYAAGDAGGIRHATVAVSDPAGSGRGGGGGGEGSEWSDGGGGGEQGVYGVLCGESGVHRVQRVPVTDLVGRTHTSTAAVVVLPQADELDVRLRDEDLRLETMRSSGAGGQSVNVTDSAVRITHLPTGLVVSCQNERSQRQNREAALKVLRSRLYDLESQKRARESQDQRSALVGSADRSERIRTYNYAQGRVTDHRIHITVHDLPSVLEGGEGLARLVAALRAAREEEALRRLA